MEADEKMKILKAEKHIYLCCNYNIINEIVYLLFKAKERTKTLDLRIIFTYDEKEDFENELFKLFLNDIRQYNLEAFFKSIATLESLNTCKVDGEMFYVPDNCQFYLEQNDFETIWNESIPIKKQRTKQRK